jgi:hypothetical protein
VVKMRFLHWSHQSDPFTYSVYLLIISVDVKLRPDIYVITGLVSFFVL